MAKFKPKCLKGEIQTAYTNRGHLIPCCYCDEEEDLATPQLQRLTNVSKVSEVEDIEQILLSEPWLKFEEDLRTENWPEIPKICLHHCTDRGDDPIRKSTYLDDKGKVISYEVI